MKKNLLLVLCLALVLSIHCATVNTIDPSAIESEIQSVIKKQEAAWNTHDVTNFMEYYWKSEDITFASRGAVSRGWQKVHNRYTTNYTPETMGILTFTELEINVLGPESAYVLGTWNLERDPDDPHGKFTIIFRKFSDGWKIIHDHTSTSEVE